MSARSGLPALAQAGLFMAASLAMAASASADQRAPAKPWREVKCERYRQAWSQALVRYGTDGLSAEFVQRHNAFIASGCDAPRDVCPRSERELAIANVMTIQAMNAGMASTFPPFACKTKP